MNNDLISRETLKEAIEELRRPKAYSEADVRQNVVIDCVFHIINNAPTVDIKDQIAGAYNEGYACGSRESTRPQGKWVKIFENPFTNGYVCPFCGHKIQVTEQFLPEVTECEACGADMQKGGAENG